MFPKTGAQDQCSGSRCFGVGEQASTKESGRSTLAYVEGRKAWQCGIKGRCEIGAQGERRRRDSSSADLTDRQPLAAREIKRRRRKTASNYHAWLCLPRVKGETIGTSLRGAGHSRTTLLVLGSRCRRRGGSRCRQRAVLSGFIDAVNALQPRYLSP